MSEEPFAHSFMQPVVEFGGYYEVETSNGTEIIPADLLSDAMTATPLELKDYLEGEPNDPQSPIQRKEAWLARMSASGYMDCTSWSAFPSEKEASDYLIEQYGDTDD